MRGDFISFRKMPTPAQKNSFVQLISHPSALAWIHVVICFVSFCICVILYAEPGVTLVMARDLPLKAFIQF